MKPYYENDNGILFNGDCLDLFSQLAFDYGTGWADLILTDPPYGITNYSWDSIIPFTDMWKLIKLSVKSAGVSVFFAGQPFTSELIHSNTKEFRYSWVWNKSNPSNPQLAKLQPLKIHEDIVVFCKNSPKYIHVFLMGALS